VPELRAAERIQAFTGRRAGRYRTLAGIVSAWDPSQAPDDVIDSRERHGRALRAHG
jgi:hypothetical protein